MARRVVCRLLVGVACIALFACVGTGRSFDTSHVGDLRNGVQDEQQVLAWFGNPVRIDKLSAQPTGCTRRWTYVHASSPYGGGRTTSRSLVVDFDTDGLVCDHAYVEN